MITYILVFLFTAIYAYKQRLLQTNKIVDLLSRIKIKHIPFTTMYIKESDKHILKKHLNAYYMEVIDVHTNGLADDLILSYL